MAKAPSEHGIYELQSGFTSGEWSPRLIGQVLLKKYREACEILENWIIYPHGPAHTRPGFIYVAAVKDSTQQCRLVPFIYSNVQAYMMELGNEYLRIFLGQLPLLDPGTGLPLEVVTPYKTADLPYLQFAQSFDVKYFVHNSYVPYKLLRQGATTWSFPAVSFPDGPYRDQNTDTTFTVQVAATTGSTTMTATQDLFDATHVGAIWRLKHSGKTQTTTFSGVGYPFVTHTVADGAVAIGTKTLSSASANFSQDDIGSDITIAGAGPSGTVLTTFISHYIGTTSVTLADTASTTVTGAAVTWSNPGLQLRGKFQVDTTPTIPSSSSGAYWIGQIVLQSSTDLVYWEDVATFAYSTTQEFVESRSGIYYRLYCKTYMAGSNTGTISQVEQWGTVQITHYNSATSVDCTVLFPCGSTDPTPDWREGAWSDYRGYPNTVLFYNDRLWFGRDVTLWGSWISDYENFNPDGDTDQAAVTYSPTQLNNSLMWMEATRGLMLGSLGEEGQISGSNEKPITQSAIKCDIQTAHGSAQYPRPLRIGQAALFVQTARRKIRELVFDVVGDGFKAPDLTLRAEHITVGGIFGSCYCQEPYSVVYAYRADGVLLTMTYMRDEDVIAWTRFTTQGLFESCASKPSSLGITAGFDELWVIVNRTINGVTKRYIEIAANHEPTSSAVRVAADFLCLDCAKTYTSPGTVTLTGLSYLEGCTVSALADGIPITDLVVSGGQVVLPLDTAPIKCFVGLPYTCVLKTFPLETPTKTGSSTGRKKLGFQLFLRLLESSGGKYGYSLTKLKYIPYDNLVADQALPLFTGLKPVSFNSNSLDLQLCIVQSDPLPLTISAISTLLEVED